MHLADLAARIIIGCVGPVCSNASYHCFSKRITASRNISPRHEVRSSAYRIKEDIDLTENKFISDTQRKINLFQIHAMRFI